MARCEQNSTAMKHGRGLWAYYQRADAPLAAPLANTPAADLERPFYVVLWIDPEGESDIDGRVVTLQEYPIQITA